MQAFLGVKLPTFKTLDTCVPPIAGDDSKWQSYVELGSSYCSGTFPVYFRVFFYSIQSNLFLLSAL